MAIRPTAAPLAFSMSTRLSVALLGLAAACGTPSSSSSASEPQKLAFEPYSAPQYTSRDVFLAASGNVVVMANRISRDGGASWVPLDPRLGALSRVAILGATVTTYATGLGLVHWDLATEAITPVAAAPSFASDRTWRTDATSGRLFVFAPIANAIAVETAGTWATASLPQPTATELDPYILDLASNGTAALTVSAWGVHRSLDHGATWQLVTASVPDAGRDLLVLADHRFLLFGGTTSYLFDAAGNLAGTVPGLTADLDAASACDDGAIVFGGKRSIDLGATWQPLVASGDLSMIVERVGCGGGRYWLLARSDAWGYRLVSLAPGQPARAAGNWDDAAPTWAPTSAQITRSSDGTFLVAGLAWRDGDPTWTLREIPPRTWAIDDLVFGVAKASFFASSDLGATWTAMPATGLTVDQAEAFARGADASLLVSAFTGTTEGDRDTWRALVWRSTNGGATWTTAYDATATRIAGGDTDGDVHRFVGVAADGAWIATDAISHDQGVTWDATDVNIDRGLAFLTPRGRLVTIQDVWQVYEDGGAGDKVATYQLEVGGTSIPGSSLRSVAFDDEGYAYLAGGAPYVQVWRSTRPID